MVKHFFSSYRLPVLLMVIMITWFAAWLASQLLSKKEFTSGYSSSPHTINIWEAPDVNQAPYTEEGDMIRYGHDLISNTSLYLGPKGKIATISNGMNCQNCHLNAGTKLWGNNYSAVFSTYPKFRDRSGTIENIYKRINDCIERSLNGTRLDTNSREIQSIYLYMKWLGKNVRKNEKPDGAGIIDLPYLHRAADPVKGKIVFVQTCQRCHGPDGSGVLHADGSTYIYPPLWGKNSYNTGAGLYRISRFAGYVKDNMPFGIRYDSTQLTNEEAWDVAAFVNSQPRPVKDCSKDWPDISRKPVDYPFGPYADGFSERQHKYGPFEPIRLIKEKKKK
jgi:thiosulfate dehydrogenase